MQRVKSENDVRRDSFTSRNSSDLTFSGSSSHLRRPQTHRWDAEQARWSGSGETPGSRTRSSDGCGPLPCSRKGGTSDGTGGLMPITERSAQSPGARLAVGRVVEGARGSEGTGEAQFRRRLGSSKSPNGHRLPRARVQQLAAEEPQEESPKGLNRALTPSMLKVVRRADKGQKGSDEIVVAPKTSEGLSVFQSSFSKQTSQRDAEDCYDSLAVPFNKQPRVEKPPAPGSMATSPGSGAARASHPAKQEDPWGRQARRSSSGDVREEASAHAVGAGRGGGPGDASPSQDAGDGYDPSRRASTESGQVDWQSSFPPAEVAVGSRQGSGSVIIPNDHIQQLLRRKLLNISTARQMDSDQSVVKIVSDSCSSTLMPQAKPVRKVRCNLTRTSRRSLLGFSKPFLFEMFSMKGKVKLLAERESGQHLGFSVLSPPAGSTKKELVASLVASTFAENQFLLIGTGPSTPISACDPDQDPVIMAVSFGKSSSGQRTVTALLPDNKKSSAGDNDLGDKQHISDYFLRFAAGEPLQDIIVLQSIPGKELVGARITKGSVKNVQLQVAVQTQEWPGATPKIMDVEGRMLSSGKLPHGRAVFEFGRLRNNQEFVCDYDSPLLSGVQALGLAVACSAPKRAFLYI